MTEDALELLRYAVEISAGKLRVSVAKTRTQCLALERLGYLRPPRAVDMVEEFDVTDAGRAFVAGVDWAQRTRR